MVCAALAFVHPQQILSKCFHFARADMKKIGILSEDARLLENVPIVYGLEATRTNRDPNRDLII